MTLKTDDATRSSSSDSRKQWGLNKELKPGTTHQKTGGQLNLKRSIYREERID